MTGANPRILQLLPALGDGGVERGTVEMAGYLSRHGMENWVASGAGALMTALSATGAHHITLEVGRKSPVAILNQCPETCAGSSMKTGSISCMREAAHPHGPAGLPVVCRAASPVS